MSDLPRILPLPPEAIAQIQSSKQITTLQGVILALVENSLDASSSKIEITVDFRRGGCSIEDNGKGIPAGEFRETGGLGRMHHTSKADPNTVARSHGSSGTFLASLAALSVLDITSQSSGSIHQSRLTLHRGKVIQRDVGSDTASESGDITRGTRVVVRDLFGNMPVRVKHRALAAESNIDHDKKWFNLKLGLLSLLFAWPFPVCIRMRNGEDSHVLQLSTLHSMMKPTLTERNLQSIDAGATRFDVQDALPILRQAGLVGNDDRSTWIPVSVTSSQLSINGSICLSPAPTKHCQFISIGVRPCRASDGYREMFDSVNKTFDNSSFGIVEDVSGAEDTPVAARKRGTTYKHKQLHGRKGIDRWPMYVFSIEFNDPSRGAVDLERMSCSSLKEIDDVLRIMVHEWLAVHHFRPYKRRQRIDKSQETPADTPKVTRESLLERTISTPNSRDPSSLVKSDMPTKRRKFLDLNSNSHDRLDLERAAVHPTKYYFSSWSRIKSGRSSFYDDLWGSQKPATAPAGQTGTRVVEREVRPATAFRLPDLCVGALNCKTGETESLHPKSTSVAPVTSGPISRPRLEEVQSSSDGFGSFDENDMLAAVQEIETNGEGNGFSRPLRDEIVAAHSPEDLDGEDDCVTWTDPVSKQTFTVNSRTGIVLPPKPIAEISQTHEVLLEGHERRHAAAIDTTRSASGQHLSLTRRPKTSVSSERAWLPGFLREWNNPVFTRQAQEQIPVITHDDARIIMEDRSTHSCASHGRDATFATSGTTGTAKLSKSALSHARVISQVDRKYILCTMPIHELDRDSGQVWVLIDQHAASERVILEQLLSELCSSDSDAEQPVQHDARAFLLHKPLRFDVSELEQQKFVQHRQRFADWGIMYDTVETQEVLTASQVQQPKHLYSIAVHALPRVIAERCTSSPKLLIDLLRADTWTDNPTTVAKNRANSNVSQTDENNASDAHDHTWLRHIGSCPRGVIDLLNSRACRSAIMFNDELSLQQCERLLRELSRCAFPFMCAHGRVSMVPIADLGTSWSGGLGAVGSVEGEKEEGSFMKAFVGWRGGLDANRVEVDVNDS